MPTLSDRLDAAAAELAPASASPTAAGLRHLSARRRQRRRKATAASVAAGALLATVGVATLRPAATEQIEAIDPPETTDITQSTGPTSTDVDASGQVDEPAGTTAPAPATGLDAWMATRPWDDRFFPLPPNAEILIIDDQTAWDLAQDREDEVFVTSDSAHPGQASLATVYVIPGHDLDVTLGPEEWRETLSDSALTDATGTEVTVRAGTTPDGSSTKALRVIGDDVLIVVGLDLEVEDAIELVLAADIVEGRAVLETPPAPFVVDSAPARSIIPGEFQVAVAVPDGRGFDIGRRERPLTNGVMWHAYNGRARTEVAVRNTTGILIEALDGDPETLVWFEDGAFHTLAARSDGGVPVSTTEELLAMADSLDLVPQSELVAQLPDDGGFVASRPETIADWLDATPLPPGWDPRPLIASAPNVAFTTAFNVDNYVECAWITEFQAAIRARDDVRRVTAIETLNGHREWPVYQAYLDAAIAIGGMTEEAVDDTLAGQDDRAAELAAITDVASLDASGFDDRWGCGFVHPADR